MAEIKRDVRSYEVDYICDKCHIGRMRPTGIALMSSPPKFPHICNNDNCKNEMRYSHIKYPFIRNEYIPEDEDD